MLATSARVSNWMFWVMRFILLYLYYYNLLPSSLGIFFQSKNAFHGECFPLSSCDPVSTTKLSAPFSWNSVWEFCTEFLEQAWVLCLLAQWWSHFTSWHKSVSANTSHVLWPVWIEIGINYMHLMTVSTQSIVKMGAVDALLYLGA